MSPAHRRQEGSRLRPEATPEAPIRVLYVVGSGRSGSTVLDTVLGSHPQVESVGELTNLVGQGFEQELFCACGQRTPECPFWARLRERWRQRLGFEDLAGYRRLQRCFERTLRLPATGLQAAFRTPAYRDYARRTTALFAALREVSGKAVLVDSSKGAPRALALACMPGIDLRLLHLVRDGRGVAYSLARSIQRDERAGVQRDLPPRPVRRTALMWTVANLSAELVALTAARGRSFRLRYEDFVTDPATTLEAIGELAGLDYSAVAAALARGDAMPVGHTVAGNRVRMSGSVRLRLDEAWREGLGVEERKRFERVAGWLLRRYGYARSVG